MDVISIDPVVLSNPSIINTFPSFLSDITNRCNHNPFILFLEIAKIGLSLTQPMYYQICRVINYVFLSKLRGRSMTWEGNVSLH